MNSSKQHNSQSGSNPIRLRKYLIPIGLLFLCILSLMAGCQWQDFFTLAGTPTAPTATASTMGNRPATQIPPTPGGTAVVKTLVIWLPPQLDPNNGSMAGSILQDRLAAFETEHPQYTVEVRIKPIEGKGGLLDMLGSTSDAAPAALPALIALPYPSMNAAVADGRLYALGSSSVDMDDPDWLPYAKQSSQVNDRVYGIPFGGDALVLAYHPVESSTPPAFWDELINRGGVVAFPAADTTAAVISQIYLSAGGHFADANGNPVIEQDPLHLTLMLISEGARKGAFPYWLSDFANFDQSWQSFLDMQSQYAIIWSNQFLQSMPKGVDIAPVPGVANQSISLIKGWAWSVPALSTADRQDSLLLLQHLSDPNFVNRWSQAAGFLPVRESGLESWKNVLNSHLVTQLTRENLLIPFGSPNPLTTPLLSDAVLKIVKNQVGYLQLEDDILSQFQVK